jgi:hypothetical protein
MENRHPAAPPAHSGGGYEKSDLSARAISLFGVILSAVVILAMVVAAWMFGFFASRQAQQDVPPSPLASTRSGPPEPRLQVNAIRDMKALRAAEDKVLTSYGWVNKDAGVARIPIDRAMQLLVERGLREPANVEPARPVPTPGGTR